MWPWNLAVIHNRMKNLSVAVGYPANVRPYIYQEVIDIGGEAVSTMYDVGEFNNLAAVIEFQYDICCRSQNFDDSDARRLLPR